MGEKIKKLLGMLFSNKKVLFLTLGLVLFLSLAPLHFVQAANIFSDILNGIKNLPISIPTLTIVVPLFVITAVLGTISTILSQIIIIFVRATMSIGVTPANQEIVRIGWEVSRDVVNLLFILILVFIGLATILRLQTYQAQKTLPLLIIIALLVNFSGVLVGFVVDLGNLITNFFLSYTANFSMLGHTLADLGGSIWDMITAKGATIFSQASGLILQTIVTLFYFLIMMLILFVVLLLFFARVIILWILAILAPFAFAAYILPATRKFWGQWWQQLIQWSIIGIPISFFLFLSGKLLEKLSVAGGDPFRNITKDPALLQSLTVVPGLDVFLTDILGKVAALAMLAVGVMLSMQMAPSGAQGIINLGKKAGIGAMKLGGLAAGTALGRKISPTAEKWGERLRGMGEKPLAGKGFWGATGKYTGFSQIARFGARQMGRGLEIGGKEISSRIEARDEAQIAAAEKKAADRNSASNINDARKSLTRGDMNSFIGYLKGTIKNGDTDDIIDAVGSGKLNWEDVAKAYKVSSARGTPHRRVFEKAFLGRMDQLGVSEENKAKIWDKITSQDLSGDIIASENLNPDSEMGQRVIDEMMLKGDSQLVPQMLRLKKKQRDPIWNYIKGKGAEWFVDNGREDILRWSTSTAARGLGLGAIGSITPPQIENMVVERDLLSKSKDQLKERLGILKNDLSSATKSNRGKILAETKRIEDELAFREKGTDELLAEKIPYAAFIEQFERLDPEKKGIKDYEINAQNRESLARINRELKRRGIETAEFTPTPKAGEQPLAVQITELREKENDLKQRIPTLYHVAKQRAQTELKQTIVKRKAAEKQFAQLPEGMQSVERYIRGTERVIKESNEDIASGEKRVVQLKGLEKEGENWLAEARKTGATKETLETREKRNAAVRKEREGLETMIKNEMVKRNEQQGLAEKYRNMWKSMAAGEKAQPIEVIIKEELGSAVKAEKQAEDNLAKVKVSRETKQVIDVAQEKLNTASQKRNFLEGELASQLRVTHLTDRLNRFNKDRGRIEDLERNISAVGTDVSETEKTIKNNLTGKGGLRVRINRIKEIKSDTDKMRKTVAEEIRPQIETEQLRLHPEIKQVPRDFLTRILKEESEKDTRVQALRAQRESAEKAANELRQQIRSEQESLRKLKNEQTKSQKEYNALMGLTGGKERLDKAIERGEKEIDDILGRKVTPKLSKKERKNLGKST